VNPKWFHYNDPLWAIANGQRNAQAYVARSRRPLSTDRYGRCGPDQPRRSLDHALFSGTITSYIIHYPSWQGNNRLQSQFSEMASIRSSAFLPNSLPGPSGISRYLSSDKWGLGTKHQPDPIMMNEGTSHRIPTFTTTPEGHPVKLLLLLALFALSSPMFSQNLAVVDVTVVDTQTGALTPHRTVLVRDGRITPCVSTFADEIAHANRNPDQRQNYRYVAKSQRVPVRPMSASNLRDFQAMLPRLQKTTLKLLTNGVTLPAGSDIAAERVPGFSLQDEGQMLPKRAWTDFAVAQLFNCALHCGSTAISKRRFFSRRWQGLSEVLIPASSGWLILLRAGLIN
jgi:hypothetical protein